MSFDAELKLMQAIERVRALADKYSKEHLVSPYPEMARQILKALDGEQE